MLYKDESVTILRKASVNDDGYDLGLEQVLIRFKDESVAVVAREELTVEPVKVPVMEEVRPPSPDPAPAPEIIVTQPSHTVLMSS